MKLYLVRHGDYQNTPTQPFDILTENGKIAITQLARFLSTHSIQVDEIRHSTKNRAKETAAILAKILGCRNISVYAGIAPMDEVSKIAGDLLQFENTTMLVSHLPFLSRLLSTLITNNDQLEIVNFKPGTIVALERLNHSRFIINWIIDPTLLM